MMASEDCASSPFHYVPCSPFLVTKAVPPSRHVPDVDHLRRKVADAVDSPFAIPRMRSVPCTPKFATPKSTPIENRQFNKVQTITSPTPQDQEVPCTPSDNRIDARTSTDGALSPCSSQDTPGDQSVCGRHVRHAARKYGLSGKPSPGTKEIDLFSGENDIFA
ncbi:Hypp2734 [Branchiostoma lanceolatum]|uniref:Hypp2734 protein n=1 Tax=Branchiostoma lanceolatum TaxID=7740 RepID=A0A8K0ERG0_BRALA|nr:Hypp2734 [Branchiostoma lanceolatum]